jgi:hypothetical protein
MTHAAVIMADYLCYECSTCAKEEKGTLVTLSLAVSLVMLRRDVGNRTACGHGGVGEHPGVDLRLRG